MELMLVELETEARFEPLQTKAWGGGSGVVLRVCLNRTLGERESGGKRGDGEQRTGVEREERGREKERSGRRRDPDPSEAKCIHPKSICLPGEGCHYS